MRAVIIFLFVLLSQGVFAQEVELVIQQGHYMPITSLIFSNNGQYIISGSEDANIKVWDIRSGKEFRALRGHTKEVTKMAISPDGNTLVSGGARMDQSLIFWDWLNGKKLHVVEKAHGNAITAIAFSNNGKLLATGSYQSLNIWDVETKTIVLSITDLQKYDKNPFRHNVESIDFSPDDKVIVTGGYDKLIKFWKVEDGSLIRSIDLNGTDSNAEIVAFTEEGDQIYHGGPLGNLVVRDVNSSKIIRQFESVGSGSSCPIQFSENLKIVAISCSEEINIWSLKDGSLLHNLKDEFYANKALTFNKNGNLLAVSGENSKEENVIRIFNVKTGSRFKILKGYPGSIRDLLFSNDNSKIISGNYHRPSRIWELANVFGFKNYEKSQNDRGDTFQSVEISPDGNTLYVGEQHRMFFYESSTGILKKTIFSGGQEQKHLAMTPDGQKIIMNVSKIKVWDAINGELLQELNGARVRTKSVGVSVDGATIFAGGYQEIKRWNAETYEELEPIVTSHYIEHMAFHPNNKEFAMFEATDLYIRDINSGESLKSIKEVWEENPTYSHDGKWLASSKGDKIIIRNTDNYGISRILDGHTDHINALHFSYDNRLLASGGDDTTIKLWDVSSGELLVTLIALNDEDFIITTPELYYLTSKNGTQGVAFRTGNKIFPFEQFDLQFNRPDKVLEKVGYASQSIMDALKRAYDKRLKRLGINEDRFQRDFHLPELSVVTQDISATTQDKILRFRVEANDTKYNLDRLQLVVNGIPVYGMRGVEITSKNAGKYTHEFELELTKGLNKVEISAMNDRGVESLRESFEINYEGGTPPVTLHLVTMGVSEYENSEMNLRYAAKDAQDITRAFKNRKQFVNNVDLGYDVVISYEMNNSLATLGNIKKIKFELNNSKVDDQVIIFVAGHGLLDENLDYFLATYDVNFLNPAENGLPYDELENILDGIPARKRTIFIDACHSGELDKEEVEITSRKVESGKVTFRNVGNKKVQYKSSLGLENSFQLSKQLFSDLRRRSGTTVISSAGGAEYALEGDEWNNGVFTYSLLSGLKEMKADLDGDGIIKLSELQSYLQKSVTELTRGRQKPTFRIENISNDFRIW